MVRNHPVQQRYALSDQESEEEFYDTPMMRKLRGVAGLDGVHDENTILNSRLLLEMHALAQQLFKRVSEHLLHQDQSPRAGTVVDALILHARS